MSTITVYHKPTWTTHRQVYAAPKESGVDFDAVDPPQEPMLRWHDATVRPRRTRGPRTAALRSIGHEKTVSWWERGVRLDT